MVREWPTTRTDCLWGLPCYCGVIVDGRNKIFRRKIFMKGAGDTNRFDVSREVDIYSHITIIISLYFGEFSVVLSSP